MQKYKLEQSKYNLLIKKKYFNEVVNPESYKARLKIVNQAQSGSWPLFQESLKSLTGFH